jgi:IS605 OrfB family transposase
VKLTAQVKLIVTPSQAEALRETLAVTNAACNAISEWAWENRTFGQFALHHGTYTTIREAFPLAAQMVVRANAKVADAYKLDKRTKRVFQSTGAIAYDDRILRWQVAKSQVSLWTTSGRMTLPFVCGDRQRELLAAQQGETDLCCIGGIWFLNATCNVEEPMPSDMSSGVLGVDLGIVELASDSEGRQYSGTAIKAYRRRLRALRAGLQKCGSKSAKRHLKRAALRGSRFTKWLNHNISRQIVQNAVSSCKALALEDLGGIWERASAFNREMRWQMGNWAFDQLKQFVAYKAKMAGVALILIDPRNTSRTCSACGFCDKANRRSQSCFLCLKCGFQANADLNASANIARIGLETRADVTQPKDGTIGSPLSLSKPPALAGGISYLRQDV